MNDVKQHQLLIDVLKNKRTSMDVAVVCGEDRLTYKDLYVKVVTLGNFLIHTSELPHKQPQNIALFIDNSIDFVVGYFAIQYIGCTVVPIDVNITQKEFEKIVSYCDIQLVLTNNEYEDYLSHINTSLVYSNINNCDELIPLGINECNVIPERSREDITIIMQTSGTTNDPKYVMLSHENILFNAEAIIDHLGITSMDKTLIVLPLRLSCNTSQMISHLLVGGTVVIYRGQFSAYQVVNEIIHHGITNISMVPPMLYLLQTIEMNKLKQTTSLRFICYSGCKANYKIIDKLTNKLHDVELIETYGLTEAGPRVCNIFPVEKNEHMNSVGKPMQSVQVKIVDDNYFELPVNIPGEIIVKSKGVMKGYYRNTVATEKILKNGWLYTGDIGYLDSENYLYIIGRKKNIINCGGNKLNPEEVEGVLLELDFVQEAYVYSVPHEILCEIPIVDVVLYDAIDIEQKLKVMQQFCRERLSLYKIPRKINIVREIEHTRNGKINRQRIKASNN